jgi:hypothetical protein
VSFIGGDVEEEDFVLEVVGGREFVFWVLFGLLLFGGGADEEEEGEEEEGEEEGKAGMEVLPVVDGGGVPAGCDNVCISVSERILGIGLLL